MLTGDQLSKQRHLRPPHGTLPLGPSTAMRDAYLRYADERSDIYIPPATYAGHQTEGHWSRIVFPVFFSVSRGYLESECMRNHGTLPRLLLLLKQFGRPRRV